MISSFAFFWWWMNRPFGTGSPEYASKWKAEFASIDTPEEAKREFGEQVAVKRFPNGEWVFGVCEDSHHNPDGGTVVLKDSTGAIRAYFGHVCGSGALASGLSDKETKSLKDFYGSWFFTKWKFKEHHE